MSQEIYPNDFVIKGTLEVANVLLSGGSDLYDLFENDAQVRSLTANWESTYTTFKNTSSTFLTSETDSQTLSFNESSKELSITSGNTISLSSLIDDSGLDVGVRSLSSNWQSTYNTVETLSSNWSIDTEVRLLTSQWESVHSTVQSNSGTNWNYQGTDLKALSSDWESTYTTFTNTSSSFIQTDVTNSTPGLSSITKIVAVSALPLVQEVGTMYVLI